MARGAQSRGAPRRAQGPTAAKYLDDFGVAMYCGFGRQPGRDGEETMREHEETVRALLAGTR